ncbi:hypothetical protein D0A37_24520 [Microcoleus vaginatus HSN003]|nr:hypothetical protein D0A37_24520 [Microcoleus vaginatus HSN003]
MAMAKIYASNPTLLINYLTKPATIALAIIFEILGIMGSFTFSNRINFSGVIIPSTLSFYDAFIGLGRFIIIVNVCGNLINLINLYDLITDF